MNEETITLSDGTIVYPSAFLMKCEKFNKKRNWFERLFYLNRNPFRSCDAGYSIKYQRDIVEVDGKLYAHPAFIKELKMQFNGD